MPAGAELGYNPAMSLIRYKSGTSAALFFVAGGLIIFLASLSAGQNSLQSHPRPVTWRVQSSGTRVSLRGVTAVDVQAAWASGAEGTFLRTTDGGASWTAAKVPGAETVDFRDIEAFSADTAFLMGIASPARIFKTEDGGRTWTERYHNDAEGIFLDAFAFFDEKNAVAIGDPMDGRFLVLVSADSGLSWAPIPFPDRPEALAGEGAFAASGTCLAVLGTSEAWFCSGGFSPRVFRSADRGLTWQAAASPLGTDKASAGGFSLLFWNPQHGVMVGGDYKDEPSPFKSAAVSRDGGRIWELVETHPPSGFRECVAVLPGTSPPHLIAVGPSGSDLSRDGGRSWTPIPCPSGLHSISFSEKGGAGWAVGRNGLIAQCVLRSD